MAGSMIRRDGPTPGEVRLAFLDAAEHQMRVAMTGVEGEVKRRAPFRTGHLRQSITSVVRREGDEIVGLVGTTTRYAPFLEFGTGLYGPRNRRIVPKKAGGVLRFPAGGRSSSYAGGSRRQGAAGPGFSLAGRQRAGRAGAQASFVFRRSVKGIHARKFFRDSIEIEKPRVERTLREIPATASRLLEGRL